MTDERDADGSDDDSGLLGRIGGIAGTVSNAAIRSADADLVAQQIDVDALVARIDVNAVLARVDVNELLDRVDVNRLLDRVEVDRLLDRVDVDRLLERADVEGLVRRAKVPEIVAESTGVLGGGTLDVIRRQVVAIDTVVTRFLRRIVGQSTGEGHQSGDPDQLSGEPAGILTRVLSVGVDLAGALMTFTVLALLASTALTAILGRQESLGPPEGPWFIALAGVWTFLWWVVSLGALGRTPGMVLVGLSVRSERDDGEAMTPKQAFVRTGVQAVLTPLFGATYVTLLFDDRRRAVHDIVADTVLVYDWGRRDAEIASPVADFLDD